MEIEEFILVGESECACEFSNNNIHNKEKLWICWHKKYDSRWINNKIHNTH